MSMMASLRENTKRSGDGREGGRAARLARAASIPGRSKGAGMQAKAWSTTSFEKLKSTKDVNACSSSTSPETDPGASSVFPFFTGTGDALTPRLCGTAGSFSLHRIHTHTFYVRIFLFSRHAFVAQRRCDVFLSAWFFLLPACAFAQGGVHI